MSECRRFHVQGRVQGVFFRASARRMAQSLALTGWVRNCSDASVEGLICGESASVDRFCDWLWTGSDTARVNQVVITPTTESAATAFEIV